MKHTRTTYCLIVLLCLVGIWPTWAEESCYEQYLREHNMKILTAEDADDSYDELKKTVLAKQMYGDSYLLMVDTVAQRAVLTKADGTYVADVHVALVDSTWYMWLSVDPLADKNPGVSPYIYCNGNPVMLIDPDGREVLNEMDSNKDPELFNVAQQHKDIDTDNTTITLYAHGSDNSIVLANGRTIRSAKQFQRYLDKYSEVWQSTDEKSELNIVLMSCNTGNTERVQSPIAEKIAERLGTTVFAPSTEVTTQNNVFYGLFRMENIDPITHKGTVIRDINHAGSWHVFTSKGMQDLGPQSCLYQYVGSLQGALEYYGK